MGAEDPRRAHAQPRPYRDDGPLPHHYPDLTTGEWIAAIIDWTAEGELVRIEGARFPDYLEAWEASRAMAGSGGRAGWAIGVFFNAPTNLDR